MVLPGHIPVGSRQHDRTGNSMGRSSRTLPSLAGRAKEQIKILSPWNLLVAAIALVLTGLVLLTAGKTTLLNNTRTDEEHPFPMKSEFPTADKSDETALNDITSAFLETSIWSRTSNSGRDWTFTDIAPLTRKGVRIGVYGAVRLESSVSVYGPVDFIRCGQTETWEPGEAKLRIGGLYIWLLDDQQQPYHLLPRDHTGDLPRLEEIQALVQSPVGCPTG